MRHKVTNKIKKRHIPWLDATLGEGQSVYLDYDPREKFKNNGSFKADYNFKRIEVEQALEKVSDCFFVEGDIEKNSPPVEDIFEGAGGFSDSMPKAESLEDMFNMK